MRKMQKRPVADARPRLKALLDQMECESPMSDAGRRKGDALWDRIVSFWPREPIAESIA